MHFRSVRATAAGATEMRPDTLLWRPASVVLDNLYKFPNMGRPIARALGELLATVDPEPPKVEPADDVRTCADHAQHRSQSPG